MRRDSSQRSIGDRVASGGAPASRRVGPARPMLHLALVALCALLGAFALGGTAQAAAPSFVSSFTGSATPDGSMTPNRLAVNEQTGVVYVIDSAHDAVDEFSSSGAYLGQLRGSQTTAGRFAFGGADDDIAVDNSGGPTQGYIYVVGENNGTSPGSQISAFNASGSFRWQTAEVVVDLFVDTCGVAVGPAGNLWVDDYFNGLQEFSPADGSVLESSVVPAQTCHMAIDSTGALYLAAWSGAVTKFAPPAPWNGASSSVDAGPDFAAATDRSNDDVYMSHSDRVVIYNSSGSSVGEFADGTPLGVTVDGVHGLVYVSDKTNGDVQIYSWPAHRLSVTVGGTASGRVDADAGLLSGCTSSGGTCSDSYKDGRVVRLTAAPDDPSSQISWSGGGCSGSGTTCLATLNGADANVTVTFSPPPAPTGTTGGSSGIGLTTATIAGTANPNGVATTDCHFDYGTTTSYGSVAPCSPAAGGGSSDVSVSASLTGLAASVSGTTYHYRLVVSNANTTSTGSDNSFTTLPDTCQNDALRCSSPCPQDLSKCPPTSLKQAGFSGTTLLLRLSCTGFAGQPNSSGKLVYKAVIKVRVKHGKKTRLVKKTITVASVSYNVAVGRTSSIKLKLTAAAKSALRSGALTATARSGFTIHLPRTKVKKKKKH